MSAHNPSTTPWTQPQHLVTTDANATVTVIHTTLTHADLCRLSRLFNATADLFQAQDIRINAWLKEHIAAAAKAEGRR